jgi:hypothetical protein
MEGENIEAICYHNGISATQIQSAKYSQNEKSILGMITNHHAMLEILMKLGLHGCITDAFISSMTVVLNGRELQADSMVMGFEWTIDSFKHKCSWFGWVETAAKSKKWKGTAPGEIVHYVSLALYLIIFIKTKEKKRLVNYMTLGWQSCRYGEMKGYLSRVGLKTLWTTKGIKT